MDARPVAATHVGGLPLDEVTVADRLRDAGYRTHKIGKWHLGYSSRRYVPTSRGFDTFYGKLNFVLLLCKMHVKQQWEWCSFNQIFAQMKTDLRQSMVRAKLRLCPLNSNPLFHCRLQQHKPKKAWNLSFTLLTTNLFRLVQFGWGLLFSRSVPIRYAGCGPAR